MPKVYFDSDSLKNKAFPKIKKVIGNLDATINASNSVHYPNGDFDWGTLTSNLGTCKDYLSTFSNWINNFDSSMGQEIINNEDVITTLTVEEVKQRK